MTDSLDTLRDMDGLADLPAPPPRPVTWYPTAEEYETWCHMVVTWRLLGGGPTPPRAPWLPPL